MQPARSWRFTALLLLWWAGGYGLVIWGVVADRGPFAFLLDAQMALFGGARPMLGALAGAFLIFVGPVLLSRLLRRIWPQNVAIAAYDQRMRQASLSRGRWADMDVAERIRALRWRRNGALAFAGLCVIAAWGISTYVTITANADAGQPLPRLTLAADQPLQPPATTDWVHVDGAQPLMEAVLVRDYSIRGTPYRDYYTPLVPAGWHPGMRVYLVEKDETYPDLHRPQDVADPPGAIEGKLSIDGPRPDVAARFRADGYAVGDWTAELARRPLHGAIPGEADFVGFLIWWMGGCFAVIALIIAGLTERQRRALI